MTGHFLSECEIKFLPKDVFEKNKVTFTQPWDIVAKLKNHYVASIQAQK